jgi:hypothetical protein
MKKILILAIALLFATTGAFAQWEVGKFDSGDVIGFGGGYDFGLFSLEGGFNFCSLMLNNPTITLKTKSWTDPAAEPDWTVNTADMPKEIGASISIGSFGVRGLFNLQVVPQGVFYLGPGVNLLFLNVGANYYDEGTAGPSDSIRIQGGISAIVLQAVAIVGAEYRLKDVPNIGLWAEYQLAYSALLSVSGNLNIVGDEKAHIEAQLDVAPGVSAINGKYALGITWHFLPAAAPAKK